MQLEGTSFYRATDYSFEFSTVGRRIGVGAQSTGYPAV